MSVANPMKAVRSLFLAVLAFAMVATVTVVVHQTGNDSAQAAFPGTNGKIAWTRTISGV